MKYLKSIRIILILAIAISLLSCNKNPPPFPEIKYHYSTIKTSKSVICVRSDIVSFDPYTLANPIKVNFDECSDIEGYKIHDAKKLYIWMGDVTAWAEEQKLLRR